jgi:hypothetical protein
MLGDGGGGKSEEMVAGVIVARGERCFGLETAAKVCIVYVCVSESKALFVSGGKQECAWICKNSSKLI